MRILAADGALTTEHSALALGFFDGVHLGHQAVIGTVTACEPQGLLPTVFTFGVSGAAPGRKLGPGLIQTPTLKTATLEAMGVRCLYWPEFSAIKDMPAERFIDEVILGRLRARVVACGGDFRFGSGATGDVNLLHRRLEAAGVRLHILPDVMVDGLPVSSTRIREAVAAGDMALAARLLGRPFAIDFVVERGRKIGRSMGLPTANQRFDDAIIRPRFGVYAARVTIDGQTYAAAANVGVKPTVGSDGVLCESYIQGFSGNIYDRRIKTELIHFLRPEQRFDSLEALRAAIEQDAAQAFALIR